jgi:hypothetical protein
MWTCPRCGRSFANRNQSHACGPLDLDRHLAGKDPEVVTVLPEKTRVAFQVRMSFAAFALRRRWVDGHVVLARRLEHPRFRRVETFSPRNHLHQFRLERLEEVDEEVAAWLAEAYRVGEQRHLGG